MFSIEHVVNLLVDWDYLLGLHCVTSFASNIGYIFELFGKVLALNKNALTNTEMLNRLSETAFDSVLSIRKSLNKSIISYSELFFVQT